jgi:hypothetical protein
MRAAWRCLQVATSVQEGVKQLEHAEKTQKKNWLLTIIAVLLAFVILMARALRGACACGLACAG